MTKVPTNDELLKLFLFGLGSTGFGILFIWIPIFGQLFFFIGGFCLLISLFYDY